MFYKNYVALCNKKNKKPGAVAKELGFSSAAPTVWKKGSVPQDANLLLIADYFGVTPEELLADSPEEKENAPGNDAESKKITVTGNGDGISAEAQKLAENRDELKKLVDRLTAEEVAYYLSDIRKTILGQ